MPDFDVVEAPVPMKPTRLQITLVVEEDGEGTKSYEGKFNFVIPSNDGREVEQRHGDLVPHLTSTQVNALKTFLDSMLTKAQGTVA